jgi:hypothetical protein
MRRVEFSLNQNPKQHIVVRSSLNKQIIDGTFLLLVRHAHDRRQFRARFRPRNKVITSPHSSKHKINILCDNHHRAHNRMDFSQKSADSRQFENAEYICQPPKGENVDGNSQSAEFWASRKTTYCCVKILWQRVGVEFPMSRDTTYPTQTCRELFFQLQRISQSVDISFGIGNLSDRFTKLRQGVIVRPE